MRQCKLYGMILIGAFIYVSSSLFAEDLKKGHVLFQLGGFRIAQGKSQFIGINGLVGNDYTLSQHQDASMFLGLGYYRDDIPRKLIQFAYGIDAFLFPKTFVSGEVIQEKLFKNLNYHYGVIYVPMYAAIKAGINQSSKKYAITIDFGVGPDLITTKGYIEHSLDGGVTIPDNAFSGRTTMALSTMIGIGIKINNALSRHSIECGYRFFYLGQGKFDKNTNQLMDSLKTGDAYINSVLCTLSF